MVVPAEAIESRWGTEGAVRLLEERFDGAPEPTRTIDHRPGTGYRLFARHFGLALVSDDGLCVRCAPPEDEPWSWQRFLVGRVLPWAAVLRGRELFHASAVEVSGGAVAVIGPSGAGKTSLASQLVLQGARFVTDDVLALHHDGANVMAHPGAGVISIRDEERAVIPSEDWSRLGAELGHSGKTYLEVPRLSEPVRLRALYFLRRESRDYEIQPLEAPDPRLLLGNTFIEGIQTPARLSNQLAICSHLAREVPMYSVAVTPGHGAAKLAGSLLHHTQAVTA